MRLLLTRAAEDSARTATKLRAMGHAIIVSPVLDMVALPAAWPSGVVDGVIATSAQAFAMVVAGPSPEAARLMPLYLVGDRTAEAAREKGFLSAPIVTQNAAGLAASVPGGGRRLVYLAGRDRKPDLESALHSRAIDVETTEVYEARAARAFEVTALEALENGAIDGVLHFSRRSANLFRRLAQAERIEIAAIAHFCLSEDVAAPFHAMECATIEVAPAPTEAALLELVGQA